MSSVAGSRVRFASALGLLASLVLGCLVPTACAPSPAGEGPANPAAAGPAPSATPARARPGDQADPTKPSGDPSPSAEGEARANRPLITLPSDATFLRTPLPPAVPDRYASWREVERIDVGQSHLMEVDRLPSGKLVTMSQAEGQVRVYERGNRRLVARHEDPNFVEFEPSALLAFPTAPDRFVLGTPRGLGLFDAMSGARLAEIDPNPVWKLRWSADQRVLMAVAAGTYEQSCFLRFFAQRGDGDLVRLGELEFEERVDAWDLSPDARLLALAHYPSGDLRVLDLQRGEELFRGPAPRYAGDVAFSPDGRFLAAAGDGLLVIDLLHTERRAFYSYVKNNMGHVRFSPSGDAVVASSYDGKLRVLGLEHDPSGKLELVLEKELSHAGDANVYAFVLSKDGTELVSASGDRTLRAFAGRRASASPAAQSAAERTFHDLDTWKQLDPGVPAPAQRPVPRFEAGQLILESELGPPRPSRIAEGRYACKITAIYKLRDCTVRRDALGRTRLEFSEENLLHLGGILWDDGPAVRFEAKLLSPSTVVECNGCERQALSGVFRGQNGHYQGLLTFRTYYDPLVPPPPPALDVRIEEANDRYPLVLEYQGPLEERGQENHEGAKQ